MEMDELNWLEQHILISPTISTHNWNLMVNLLCCISIYGGKITWFCTSCNNRVFYLWSQFCNDCICLIWMKLKSSLWRISIQRNKSFVKGPGMYLINNILVWSIYTGYVEYSYCSFSVYQNVAEMAHLLMVNRLKIVLYIDIIMHMHYGDIKAIPIWKYSYVRYM